MNRRGLEQYMREVDALEAKVNVCVLAKLFVRPSAHEAWRECLVQLRRQPNWARMRRDQRYMREIYEL